MIHPAFLLTLNRAERDSLGHRTSAAAGLSKLTQTNTEGPGVSLFNLKTARLNMKLWCHTGTVLCHVTTRAVPRQLSCNSGKARGSRSANSYNAHCSHTFTCAGTNVVGCGPPSPAAVAAVLSSEAWWSARLDPLGPLSSAASFIGGCDLMTIKVVLDVFTFSTFSHFA